MPPTKLARREFLKASAFGAAALAAGVASADTSDFSFLVMNDLHWLDENCTAYHRAAFSRLREDHDYAFVLVAGDLATDGRTHELQGIADALEYLGAPNYPVMGNHDYATEKATWVEVFGPRRLNYRFDYHGWTFLGLDSTEQAKYQEMSVQPDTIQWLRAALTRIPASRPIVTFTHFPLGDGVAMRPGNADEVLALFEGHNLRHIFSGHFHGITEREIRDATTSTCACLAHSRGNHDGTSAKGCFLASVKSGELSYEFVEYKHGV